MKLNKFTHLFTSLVVSIALMPVSTEACTGIQLKAKDGSIINSRTVEFGVDLKISGIMIPRNLPLTGTLPDGSKGFAYTTKYAAMGGNNLGEDTITDGINEKGLVVADFYFPKFAKYSVITAENKNRALSPTEFSTWLLSQFATVDEVKEGVKSVVIAPTVSKGWPMVVPLHYIVYDKTGKSIVIEPLDGQLKVFDNPIGVLTNAPSFDWHMTNLASYVNLSPHNVPSSRVMELGVNQIGEGSGMHGLPGDFTPPSRFVRAAFYSLTAAPAKTGDEAVMQSFHILNQFDIPRGSVRHLEDKQEMLEYTQATIVRDPQNLRWYFRTFDDQTIKVISMKNLNLDAKSIQHFSMGGAHVAMDVSNTVA